ncbi:MAG: response regulator [Deltaproteobacteria bacterium]|jgi:two-component system, response regulator PdtaR|nr:response regulator [Deltaproteobacteria bacterium]
MEKAKILIVEDEAIIGMEIENQLQSLGYEVTSMVDTGEKAIQKAEADKPDLMLMDIRIKGEMDGIDAAEIIRNRFDIPVIFSTAYLDQERIERAKITMPFGYVLKPIQERDLKVTLEMALYVAKVDAERKQMEGLLRIQRDLGISLGKSMDLQEMLQLCMKAALEASNMDCGGIYIIDPATKSFDLTYHVGLSEDFVTTVSCFESGSPQAQMVMAGDPAYANHDQLGVDLTEVEQNEKLKSMAIISVKYANQVIGCLNVASHNFEEIPMFVRNTLETIVTQIGDAIVKKQAEEKLIMQASLLEQVHNAIITIDFNNIILSWNGYAEKLYQWTREEAIGKNIIELLAPEELKDETLVNFEKLNKDGHWEGDYDVKRKDGSPIAVHIINTYLKHITGENIGFIGISMDITERKQVEINQLKIKNQLQNVIDNSMSNISIKD